MTTEAHTYTAPEMDLSALDNMPPISDIGMAVGAILALGLVRILWAKGLGMPMCWLLWFCGLMSKQGFSYLLVNPLYCFFAPLLAGFITFVVIAGIGEILTAPGKVYGKITR